MKIGIIGPSKIKKEHKKEIPKIAKLISLLGHKIVIVPEDKSVPLFFAEEYIKNKGKKVYSIVPLDDYEFGNDWVRKDIGEIINCQTWRNQPEKFNEESEILISLGYCTGGIIEICYSKWFGKNKIYILKEFGDTKLPEELKKDLNLKYISINQLKKELQ